MSKSPILPKNMRPDYQWVFAYLDRDETGEEVALFVHRDIKGISDRPARLPDQRVETRSALEKIYSQWKQEAEGIYRLCPDFAMVSGLKGKAIQSALQAFERASSHDNGPALQMAASSAPGAPSLQQG